MRVINRQGVSMAVSYDEIKERIARLCSAAELEKIDVDRVVIQTINGIYDGISTSELDDLSARICASLQSVHYLYDTLAARILVSNITKNLVFGNKRGASLGTFSARTAHVAAGPDSTLSDSYVEFVRANAAELDAAIQYELDSTHSYFALRTLEKSYLMRSEGAIAETPQDMWMRVAVTVAAPVVEDVVKVYGSMSRGEYTHATPTLFNAGMRVQQCSSCFAAGTEVATVNAGVKRIEDVAIGDLVVTHLGNVKPVTQLHRNELAGRRLYDLRVSRSRPVTVTGNHRLWAVRDGGGASPSWIAVDDLCVGDYVGIPRRNPHAKASGAPDVLPIWEFVDDPRRSEGFFLDVDEELAEFIGRCIASGSFLPPVDRPSSGAPSTGDPRGVSFALTASVDDRIVDDIVRVGQRVFGVDAEVTERSVVFESQHGVRFVGPLLTHLLRGSPSRLPTFAFSLPRSVALSLGAGLTGLTTGDGTCKHVYHLFRMHGIVAADGGTLVVEGDTFLRIEAKAPSGGAALLSQHVYTLGVEDDHSYSVEGLLAENCYLLGTDDSLSGIFKTLGDCAQISKWAGGIGLHVSNVRAKGSKIASTNGTSDGIVPMLRVYNECARYCNQSGRRKGSIAVYLEPWHADVWEFVELRRNVGAETERARDLFLALWVPDEFMRRLEADEDWFLMSPDQCPGLIDAFDADPDEGGAFSALYNRYVAEGKFMRKIRARSLWQHVLNCQLETGVPYIMYKDHVNRKCNQSNVGTVRSSNLCAEITEYSDSSYYAVCNLASIAVNRFVVDRTVIDHERLHEAAAQIVRNLNRVIDVNTYPTAETERSNSALRPIGIGVQGLGDVYCMLGLPYDDPRAVAVDAEVLETIYHGAVTASVELAERDGPYSRFEGSPASEGRLQFDLWGLRASDLSGRWDWDALKDRVASGGLRNSLLTALMPTATTSQILGNCESFEPFQANVFKRSTIAGEFVVVNRHLMDDMMALGLWTEDLRRRLLARDGSVQALEDVPEDLKRVYRTVWEVPQRSVIDHAAARGPFVDQSQSMNLYMASPSFQKLSSALVYAWKRGLKTGVYYLRSTAAVEAIKYGILPSASAKDASAPASASAPACKLRRPGAADPDEPCTMCSS